MACTKYTMALCPLCKPSCVREEAGQTFVVKETGTQLNNQPEVFTSFS